MRKERSERAKVTVKKEQASSPLNVEGGIAMPGNLDGIVSELDANEAQLTVPGGRGVTRVKSKNTKKKKGKR
jgi:hypothetical protein